VGQDTFGYDRYLNQILYQSSVWKSVRDEVIIRDNGCDLGIPGYDVVDKLVVHHINPITKDQIEHVNDVMFNPDFLICTSHRTHIAIHYGDERLLPKPMVVRCPGDTVPWR
jgi:5-methylcytosine-specific restriction endonuclease McrA